MRRLFVVGTDSLAIRSEFAGELRQTPLQSLDAVGEEAHHLVEIVNRPILERNSALELHDSLVHRRIVLTPKRFQEVGGSNTANAVPARLCLLKAFSTMNPMKNTALPTLLLVLLVGVPATSRADVVFLKSGGKLEGRIVERSEDSVEINIGAGSITLSMKSVDRIEEGRSPLDDYDERVAALSPDDREGWLGLARWASRAGLGTQSRWAYERVLKMAPEDPEANRAVGRVEVDGRWMTEEEGYRARGYVNFEGQWVTPAQQDAILRGREADRAAAEARALQADAQAREAEARAREAEAEAKKTTDGIPLYWGVWGPGPNVWPSNPLDRPQPNINRTQGRS
jgi:hypothetical protein